MRAMIAVIIAFGVVVLFNMPDANSARNVHPKNWCNAPCVIYFGERMHEDQFCIDYRGNGTLRVWRDNDTVCRGR